MAITITTLVDGPRLAVVHVFVDGAADITQEIVYNANALIGDNTSIALVRVQYATVGLSGYLSWGGTSPKDFYGITADRHSDMNFADGPMSIGGLSNDSFGGNTPNGNILFSTLGMGATDHCTFVLYVQKKG